MRSRWSDADASAMVDMYRKDGIHPDVALRVYSTRLLGVDPALVLHGGGNTSVKTRLPDVYGNDVDVLCVKGSGWSMDTIEPAGLPAVRLDPIRALAELESLGDEQMVNACRLALLDSTAPTPSVETLLHAFLPQKFVDHTHANAILALTDQADGAERCRAVFGDEVIVLPYIFPGFELAQVARRAAVEHGQRRAMILMKHGIFTFDDDARAAYEYMIELVDRAEQWIRGKRRAPVVTVAPAPTAVPVSVLSTIIRGVVARIGETPSSRFVITHRDGPRIRAFVDDPKCSAFARGGVVTPDHVIRTKRLPLITAAPDAARLGDFRISVESAAREYVADYQRYFQVHNERWGLTKTALDPYPRVVLVPGAGLFALGASARAAQVAADVAEAAMQVIDDANQSGTFESISEAETFDMEYWSLEQAKLGNRPERPLARQVAVITGGGGVIGKATGQQFAALGAEVVLLDVDAAAAEAAAAEFGGLGLACDVTSAAQVRAAFDHVCTTYGGVDIVVSNAGNALQSPIGSVDDDALRASFELNFFAHQSVAANTVRIMCEQGVGGVLLFNLSKQAVNPGAAFGPYGIPKAATLALMRQYAIDYGEQGIRSNGVNADRIRSGLLTDNMIASRATARGVSEENYMTGNLLGREVTAGDVAQAFVNLALARGTTGAILTVDGGNIAAALR